MDLIASAKEKIASADKVLIGAGAGLSAAAGLTYSGSRFEKKMAPFIYKYQLPDMYSAGFYPYPSPEAEWAYWAKHISTNRYEPGSLPLYQELFKLVKDKDYFVITTNVDGQFEQAGFDTDRLFAVQGDYGNFQCSVPCQQVVYDNEDLVKDMIASTDANLEIDSSLLPTCPNCGAPLTRHLRVDDCFVQDASWYASQQAYAAYLDTLLDKKVVLLELGVGYNTPTIIRYPFEQLTYSLTDTTLIRLNATDTQGPAENVERTITLTDDMTEVLDAWTS